MEDGLGMLKDDSLSEQIKNLRRSSRIRQPTSRAVSMKERSIPPKNTSRKQNVTVKDALKKSPTQIRDDKKMVELEDQHLEQSNKARNSIHKPEIWNKNVVDDDTTNVEKEFQNPVDLQCNFCRHTSVNSKALDMHKHSKHNIRYDTNIHKVYTCEICGYETLMATRLDMHMASHSNDRPHVCKICQKPFKLPHELTMHIRVHKDPSILDCGQCGKTFANIYNLKIHVEHQHEGGKKFLCHLCTQRTVNQLHLDRHLYKKHDIPLPSDCKILTCDVCGYEVFQHHKFLEHMKIHKGDKTFLCNICKKGFVSKQALGRHALWHGEKHLRCTFHGCRFATIQKNSLAEHVRLMHTGKYDKPHGCHLCGFRTGLKGNLKKHLKRTHKVMTSKHKQQMVVKQEQINDLHTENSAIRQEFESSGFEIINDEAIDNSQSGDSEMEDKCLSGETIPSGLTQADNFWPYNISHEDLGADYGTQGGEETTIIIRELSALISDSSPVDDVAINEALPSQPLAVICDEKKEPVSVLGFKFIL